MTCEDSAASGRNHERERLVRVSVARVGTADFDAGGWEGPQGRPDRAKIAGITLYWGGRAGQLFTPLGRYAARNHAPSTLRPLSSSGSDDRKPEDQRHEKIIKSTRHPSVSAPTVPLATLAQFAGTCCC